MKKNKNKRFYRIAEVAALLEIQPSTLRYWEEVFPMFNPYRLPSGQRRFTQDDVNTAKYIYDLLYVKGLKIENAVEYMNKNYRKYAPRRQRVCRNAEDAIKLLNEVKSDIENPHTLAKIEAIIGYINTEKAG